MSLGYQSSALRSLACAIALVVATVFWGMNAEAAVVISKKPTKNMVCSAGVCAPTKGKAVLNATDLANLLASNDVRVISDKKAKDVEVEASLSWISTSRLTFDAYRSITVEQPIAVAGTGALTITTNDGGSDGDYSFANKGHVEFWDLNSNLVINGSSYTLARSVKQLSDLIAESPSGYFALARGWNSKKDGTYSQSPISTTFTGTFTGLGNTVSNLTINSAQASVGLFAHIDTGSVLRDVNLADANVVATGNANWVGALVAEDFGGTLRGIHASVSVSANLSFETGGLAGLAQNSTIWNSSTAGSVGGGAAGGLVGYAYNSEIHDSHSTAAITTGGEGGGLVGETQGTSISRSYATGAVSVFGYLSGGGLVGINSGSIDSSYSTGEVIGTEHTNVGGLVGRLDGGYLTNCYSIGGVTGGESANVGGLIGSKPSTSGPVQCYSTGAVSGGTSSYVGGFTGLDANGLGYGNDYWDLDTSGVSDPNKGCGNYGCSSFYVQGLTDDQLKSALPSGFDPSIWGQNPNINDGYPYLLANPPK